MNFGHLFITVGQSNSCNFGGPDRQRSTSGMALAYNGFTHGWQPAHDPIPPAAILDDGLDWDRCGTMGSPWPRFCDLLAERTRQPVGILSLGWGGTTSKAWMPGEKPYTRLDNVLAEFGQIIRGGIIHQGEGDVQAGTPEAVYRQRWTAIIQQTRIRVGWNIPWLFCEATRIAGVPAEDPRRVAILAAQRSLMDGVIAFPGVHTDDLSRREAVGGGTHFDAAALDVFAQRLSDVICQRFGW